MRTVYKVFVEDCCLGVFKTFKKAKEVYSYALKIEKYLPIDFLVSIVVEEVSDDEV